MKLSNIERTILINQYKILEELTDNEYEQKKFNIAQDILYYGYTKLYSEVLPDLEEEDDHQFVIDVLKMHRDLLYSYKLLNDTEIDEDDVKFDGFDGNNEGQYFMFAKFLLEKMDQFRDVRENLGDYNSHRPMVSKYSRQLQLWKPLKDAYVYSASSASKGFTLTEEQIKEILKA